MEVTSLGLKDLNACLELDRLVLNGLWTKEQWRKELGDSRRICLGIIDSAKLLAVACGWLVVDELHITAVAVHPEHRRQGLGQLVLLTMIERSEMAGATCATLEVDNKNSAAKALYKSCGFKTAGCRRNYYKNRSDGLIQWKSFKGKQH